MAVLLHSNSQVARVRSALSYQPDEDPTQKKVDGCRKCFQPLLQGIGRSLRNTFYLPWSAKVVSPAYQRNQLVAEDEVQGLKDEHKILPLRSGDLSSADRISEFFSTRDIEIRIEGPISQIFKVRLFDSKKPIGEKNLRMILFSFNGNREVHGANEAQNWDPLTIQSLSESILYILKALKSEGIGIDSLMTTSLGNVVLAGLDKFADKKDFEILPPTLIINRGLTSIEKVAGRLFPRPISSLLHFAARLSKWDANPEQDLLKFLEAEKKTYPLCQRKIILIEAIDDTYFSGKGRFALDVHERIKELGHRVFRANFWPTPFQDRAHHAISLDFCTNNKASQILDDTVGLRMHARESMASAIARKVFLEGDKSWHTCFCAAGNDAKLDLATLREAMPLLSAFIKEAHKLAEADESKPKAASFG